MISFAVNYVGVIAATIVAMIVGFVWYSKPLFGKVWSKQTGVQMGGNSKGMGKTMIAALFASLITAYILAVLISSLGATTISGAVWVAVIVWLGFVVSFNIARMAFEKTSMDFFLEEIGHHLVAFVLMSIVIVLV